MDISVSMAFVMLEKGDGMSMSKEFDPYKLILNKEIREYFKKNRKFTILEQIQIILHSYATAEVKLMNLYSLAESVDEQYRNRVLDIAKIMEFCIERASDIQYVPKLGLETKYINGKEEIMGFYPEQNFLCKKGFSKEAYKEFVDWGICHIKLPFEHGCRIRIKTPDMDKAIYGTLDAEEDGNGCWYYFVIMDDNNAKDGMIDISYHEIGVKSGYVVYDWVERIE